MSDNSQGSSSMSNIALPQVDGFTFREAFIIIGIVMALIISLLILRFGCNVIVVDLCIMCDLQEAKRECIKFRDHYLPYFTTTAAAAAATTTTNTATRPSGRGRRSEQLQEVQRIPNQETEIELMNLDSLMSGLLLQERWQVMQMLLPEKVRNRTQQNKRNGI
mmetsp:Transcript_2743/g.3914  ORF Transcript_2743/g.3914 Transcript_2743/m.3914 type:complete len:163 (+) Transcript_2743:97-585(+)